MNVINNLIQIILLLGIIQGFIYGVLLISNRKKDRSTLFLGFFVLVYALELTLPLIKYSNLISDYPQLRFIPFDFRYLTFPLFYIYVKKISILPKSKNILYILIPGLIAFIINVIVFFQDVDTKKIIGMSSWFQTFDLIGLIFSLFIGVITYLFINKHTSELKNQYSFTQGKELKWAKQFLVIGFIYMIIIFCFNINHFYFHFITSIINVVLLYWISIRGLHQKNIKPLVQFTEIINTKDDTPLIQKKEVDIKLFEKIEKYVLSEKLYKQSNLTITDLTKQFNEHPKLISSVINLVSEKNFRSYINSFRIKEAKKLLKDNHSNNLSIEGIGFEVGFQSKSAFYQAFKKETGTTPSNYKNVV